MKLILDSETAVVRKDELKDRVFGYGVILSSETEGKEMLIKKSRIVAMGDIVVGSKCRIEDSVIWSLWGKVIFTKECVLEGKITIDAWEGLRFDAKAVISGYIYAPIIEAEDLEFNSFRLNGDVVIQANDVIFNKFAMLSDARLFADNIIFRHICWIVSSHIIARSHLFLLGTISKSIESTLSATDVFVKHGLNCEPEEPGEAESATKIELDKNPPKDNSVSFWPWLLRMFLRRPKKSKKVNPNK